MKSKRRMPADNRSEAETSGRSEPEYLLVQKSVWRAVEEAAGNEASIPILKTAGEIGNAFPKSGLSARDIADALVFAAVDAGVAVERPIPQIRQPRLSRLPRLSLGMLRGANGPASPPADVGLQA